MQQPRREFLRTVTAGAAAAATANVALLNAAQGKSQKMLPIVDTHQHLWDLSKLQPPWLGEAPKVLGSSHVTSDFLTATKGLNVVKAVYMEVDVSPKDQVAEANHVISLCKSDEHPTVAAVISGRPNSEGFRSYIQKFKGSPYIKGVRQVLHTTAPKGLCTQEQFIASMKLLGELGMSFDLCMRPTELSDGAKLAGLCPQTRFIVDHCGNADPKAFLKEKPKEEPWHEVDQWKRDMAALADKSNVVCKISGIIARSTKPEAEQLAPIINFCLDTFGPDRVVFGGDWPVCKLGGTYKQWVEALKEVIADRSESHQKKLLHDNAVRLYRLG